MRKYFVTGLSVLTLCVLTQGVLGQDDRRDQQGNDDRVPVTAERFVQLASASGIAEVAFGKMAAQKAASEDVRKFGQMMVEDHTKANKELMTLAETKRLPVARDMDRRHQEMQRRLAGLTGAAFDREYMMGQVKDHEEAVSLFSKFAEGGKDSDLKAFATQTLPHLKEHLQKAKDIAAKLKDIR